VNSLIFLDSSIDLGTAVAGTYDLPLVVLSVFIACIASYAAFAFSERITVAEVAINKFGWLTTGAVAMGSGVWAMHFIGMLAFILPLQVGYDLLGTGISMVPAVLAAGAALYTVSQPKIEPGNILVGGLFMGTGIGIMHYAGMAAMRVDAVMRYDPTLFAVSFAVAIVLATVSLYLKSVVSARTTYPSPDLKKIGSALVMGIAVSGMHYTAMAATYFFPGVGDELDVITLNPRYLAISVGLVTTLIIALLFVATVVGRRLEAALRWEKEVAERKQVEIALRESENLLNSIIENVPVGLLLKDSDHIVERANSTYLNWYGFDADTMVGHRSDEIEDFQSIKEAEFMNAQEREVLNTGRTLTRLVKRPFADNRVHTVSITKFPVYDRQGNITKVGSVSIDLTEQVQAQNVANAALRVAETANRAKSEFLAAMSHDFRTPLNAILGFAEILMRRDLGPSDDKYREYAADIRSSGQHLLTLVNEILDIAAIEDGKQSLVKETLFTWKVVRDCKRIVAERARSNGIDMVTEVPKNLPLLYADKRAAMQILLNLLSNAIKFTPKGGKITVSAKASKRNTTLTVADTGKGIPADKLPNLIEPFKRANTDSFLTEESWGLGLTIAKSLVDLHDGKLKIKSKLGKGTTVTVTLPNGTPQ
jgi:two-component system, sensor histidine kinase and response regulator